jgi:hypothetical protein
MLGQFGKVLENFDAVASVAGLAGFIYPNRFFCVLAKKLLELLTLFEIVF